MKILNKIKNSFFKSWRGEEKLWIVFWGWGVLVFVLHILLLKIFGAEINQYRSIEFDISVILFFFLADIFTLFLSSWKMFFLFFSLLLFLYFSLLSLRKTIKIKGYNLFSYVILFIIIYLFIQTIPLVFGLFFGIMMGIGSL